MNAKGWALGRQDNNDTAALKADVESSVNANRERAKSVCADPKFAAYYSKTACLSNEITFEQLADMSKISPAAKAIFVELRGNVDSVTKESLDLQRKYGGTAGAKRADLYLSMSKAQNDKNNLDLYNGTITWGEYNRRRQAIFNDYLAASKNIAS
jgi:hypothetical protein